MRSIAGFLLLLAGAAHGQQLSPEANSIVVTAARTVVLTPTDVSFLINLNVDFSVTLDQVLSIVDFGLTTNDIVSISSYAVPAPYAPSSAPRITYTFRLSVPMSRTKDTVDKLEKLRKTTDTGIDLTYSTTAIGPTQAAVDAVREKVLSDLVADARKRAESIAAATGLKLGGIQAVNETYTYPGGYTGPLQPMVTFSAVFRFASQ